MKKYRIKKEVLANGTCCYTPQFKRFIFWCCEYQGIEESRPVDFTTLEEAQETIRKWQQSEAHKAVVGVTYINQ